MKRVAIALILAVTAGCNGSRPRPPEPPAPPPAGGSTVALRRHQIAVTHLLTDPERRFPRMAGRLCSWDRDRFLHFSSTDSPEAFDVLFLKAAGRVTEVKHLAGYSDAGLTSKDEVRHALFLAPGTVERDGIRVGDTVGFSPAIAGARPAPMPVVKVGGHEVYVETSHLLVQRMRGLMHRPRLSKDDGMLFLYSSEDDRSFWMKNTLIPLDIAYFAEDGRLLNVARMKPHPDPSQGGELRAPSAAPARFVLEVNYGWFDARKLIDADGRPAQPVRLELPESLRKLLELAE